jgi:type I restriction enzyme, S subunit
MITDPVPEGWKLEKISDFAFTKSGGTPSTFKAEYWEGGDIPWLPSGKCQNCVIDSAEKFITDAGLKNSSAVMFPKNSILIALTGATTGKIGYLTFESSGNQSITSIQPNNKYISKYLYYYLQKIYKFVLTKNVGAAQPHINKKVVDELVILLPPFSEQEKIADILSKTDYQIQLTGEIIAKTEKLKKGLMQQLLTKGIGDEEFKEFKVDATNYKICSKWQIKNLEDISSIKGRIGWKGYTVGDLRNSGPLTLGAKNIDKNNKLDLKNSKYLSREKYLESPEIMVEENEILIVQRGSLGKIVIIDEPIGEATINPSMVILKDIKINSYFLYYFLCSDIIQKHIVNIQTQTGVPMISQKQCKNFKILIPRLDEQNKIASILIEVDKQIKNENEELEILQKIKKGLMQDLLSGKIRVKI